VAWNLEFDQIAKELDIPFKRTGMVDVGFDSADRKKLEELQAQGDENGVPGLEIIVQARLQQLALNIRGNPPSTHPPPEKCHRDGGLSTNYGFCTISLLIYEVHRCLF